MFMILLPDDNAALLTVRGKIHMALTHHVNDLEQNADAVQGMMVGIMKYQEAKQGDWVWKIRDGWQTLSGMEVERIP